MISDKRITLHVPHTDCVCVPHHSFFLNVRKHSSEPGKSTHALWSLVQFNRYDVEIPPDLTQPTRRTKSHKGTFEVWPKLSYPASLYAPRASGLISRRSRLLLLYTTILQYYNRIDGTRKRFSFKLTIFFFLPNSLTLCNTIRYKIEPISYRRVVHVRCLHVSLVVFCVKLHKLYKLFNSRNFFRRFP